ncbi:acidic mammalian chitinase-like isoform X1 [Phlebotomus papatasi]|uniref:acidic mammalian chitinase-like isoform X1 n=2 Tax=Phlebotomus papatasi TaxID=29031 RepID=UPI002483B487|nr:acidic mammalian chitinase-like isoform X1 [Phlebotomus papatasi]XP_055699415.1 acidic mammalian chitinase-like isoform X1 [Phlebotomus papatasi]XP_055699416.1 acidic mammalian chitinase-like isoform X1 [Phlebotomus papatasi]
MLRILVIFAILMGISYAENCPEEKNVVVCYYSSWAVYRRAPATFRINYIDPKYCTHLVYTFAGLNLDGIMDTLDYTNDITNGGYRDFTGIKEKYPCVKTLLAIGGWNEGSEKYSLMVETEESREYFVSRVMRYLVQFGFDGLDIDWEYPGHRGGIPEDKENFTKLLEMLKERLKPRNRLLTAALAAPVGIIKDAYDVQEVCKYLDLVMIMGYDMNETNKTSTHAPLKRESSESNTRSTVDDAVQFYSSNGCDRKQLVIGIPAYGKSYTLADKTRHGIGNNVLGPGKAGPYLMEPGFLGYNEICESLTQAQWTTVHLKNNAMKYSYNDDQWVSYDDAETVAVKSRYAKTEGLAGVMIWTIDTDDFHGDCNKQAFPLLLAVNKALGRL